MDTKTLTALKGSIAKWEAIVAGTGEDRGTENCPLCAAFYHHPKHCEGCPVERSTGQTMLIRSSHTVVAVGNNRISMV